MTIDRKAARKRITEQVLIERLSLDEEWSDPENIHVQFHDRLPESLQNDKFPAVIREIEQDVDRLVARGCHRGVVYWCLERLLPEEEQLRLKGAPTSVLDEDNAPIVKRIPSRPLATREDMSVLESKLGAVSKEIKRYQRELLLMADAFPTEYPLPEGLLTEGPCDPADALLLLQSSLTWAQKLAENWAAPQLSTIMRSKGTLYLIAYVSMRSLAGERPGDGKGTRNSGAALGNRVLLRRPDAKVIAQVIHACSGIGIHEDDIVAKLRDFRADYPSLYNRLVDLMEHLHAAACS